MPEPDWMGQLVADLDFWAAVAQSCGVLVQIPLLFVLLLALFDLHEMRKQSKEMVLQSSRRQRELALLGFSAEAFHKAYRDIQQEMDSVLLNKDPKGAPQGSIHEYFLWRAHALDENEVKKLAANGDATVAVLAYLNKLEVLALGVLGDVYSEDSTYDMWSHHVLRANHVLKPFIKYVREKRDDSQIFIKMEELARRWALRAADEKAKPPA